MEDKVSLSKVILGGNIFGAYADFRETANIISCAQEFGVSTIDTADVYSAGLSEELIGKTLAGKREQFLICSKVGLDSAATSHGFLSGTKIQDRCEASLRRLNTDYIDYYQVHHFDPLTPLEHVFDQMKKLVTSGKVRNFGVSNFSRQRLEEAENTEPGFVRSVQNKFNIFYPKHLNEFNKIIFEKKPLFIAYGVMGRGILSGKYQAGVNSAHRASQSDSIRKDLASNELKGLVQVMAERANQLSVKLSALVLACSFYSYALDAAVLGVRTVAQLNDYAAFFEDKLGAREIDFFFDDVLKSYVPIFEQKTDFFGADKMY
jgi:aryl-alcohol dehydrogenase-like predicted oxidoreductase